jgi:hypothetical protein
LAVHNNDKEKIQENTKNESENNEKKEPINYIAVDESYYTLTFLSLIEDFNK